MARIVPVAWYAVCKLYNYIANMNKEQKDALEIAVAGHNLLLLGSAGTGKSFTVCEIYKRLSDSGKKVQLTCSTGIACSLYHK